MNEIKFIELYAEIMECSVNRARAVYMVISEAAMPGPAGPSRGRSLQWTSSVAAEVGEPGREQVLMP